MFLLDQAGKLKIRWNLVLYARLWKQSDSTLEKYMGSMGFKVCGNLINVYKVYGDLAEFQHTS